MKTSINRKAITLKPYEFPKQVYRNTAITFHGTRNLSNAVSLQRVDDEINTEKLDSSIVSGFKYTQKN